MNLQKVDPRHHVHEVLQRPDERSRNVCPNVGWLKDFNDAQASSTRRSTARTIVPENNSNWPLLNDPAINNAIDKAKLIDDPERAHSGVGRRSTR